MQDSTDLRQEARRLLQVELARKDMGYKELSRALAATCGVDIDSKALSNKVGRGTFSFAFFLQCMKAMDIKNVSLAD